MTMELFLHANLLNYKFIELQLKLQSSAKSSEIILIKCIYVSSLFKALM